MSVRENEKETSGESQSCLVTSVKSQASSTGLVQFPPSMKLPPHCLLAVSCRLKAGQGQSRVLTPPIGVSSQLKVMSLVSLMSGTAASDVFSGGHASVMCVCKWVGGRVSGWVGG